MDENRYPVGIQSFAKIRNSGKIYVDKTNLVHRLVSTSSYYFLSRPRRFGKSLLVSTLEEYFLGHKELFKGLAIESLQPDEWPVHPVFHFDMSKVKYSKTGELAESLNLMLKPLEEKYGRDEDEIYPKFKFIGLIDRAYKKTGRQVVVLIDEYDIPIINSLDKPELEKHNRTELKDFYGVMKSMDAKLRFVLLTGVGKLGHLSVFSDLNNLRDISLLPAYSTLCGITKEELHEYFDEGIGNLAEANGWDKEQTYAELKKQYDGYHFARNLKDIYNPFSILNSLADQQISDYWFQTGTPTHLLHVLRNSRKQLSELNGCKIKESVLNSADVMTYQPDIYMFYTGYLTFKAYDERFKQYTLGYPNQEVKNGFLESLLPIITKTSKSLTTNLVVNLSEMISEDRLGDFLEAMKVFFAGIPYDMECHNEYFYQNVIYCIATLLGFYTQAEYHTSQGRVDMVVANDTTIYVMEFKLDGSPLKAMTQINNRNYALPFKLDGRQVVKVGVDFSSESRTISGWTFE